MTRVAFVALVRHFARMTIAPPLLTDLGNDFLRRTLASVCAILLVAGIFLTRALFRKYVDLHALWDEAAYFRAVEADTLLMIALPMLIIGLLSVLVAPMLFPDDVDYRTLAHLPVSRLEIFAAKFVAVGLVAGVSVLAVNLVTSLWFPTATGGRWMPHSLPARMGAHAVASLAGSFWMFSAIMALQGLCLSVLPTAWRRRASVAVHGIVFVGLLISLPYVLRIPTAQVSNGDVWRPPLAWMPPIWFLGVDRWLLDPSAEGYAFVARLAILSGLLIAAIIVIAYAYLYRHAEALAIDGSAGSRAGRRAVPDVPAVPDVRDAPVAPVGPVAPVYVAESATRAILSFALSGLKRSRMHQLVLLLVVGVGLALLIGQLSTFFEGVSFLGYRPRQRLHAVIAAPLLVGLSFTLALRAVFLLPLDQQATWLFRLTETPQNRPHALNAVAYLLTFGAVVPAFAVALAIQPRVLGSMWIASALLTTLANLVLVEITLRDWTRLPFTCTYLPGKRVLAYTLGVLLGVYFVFVYLGANLIRASLAGPVRTAVLGAVLLAALAVLRRSRLRAWGKRPLEFEDEDPLAIRTLNLLPDERH